MVCPPAEGAVCSGRAGDQYRCYNPVVSRIWDSLPVPAPSRSRFCMWCEPRAGASASQYSVGT